MTCHRASLWETHATTANPKVLTLLQGIRDAKSIDAFGRVKFPRDRIRELANDRSIPLHVLGQIVVPSFAEFQKTHIHSVVCRMISKWHGKNKHYTKLCA